MICVPNENLHALNKARVSVLNFQIVGTILWKKGYSFSNPKFDRLDGHLSEIATISIHKTLPDATSSTSLDSIGLVPRHWLLLYCFKFMKAKVPVELGKV